MEETNIRLQSIWGKWWEPIRKWFYPLWLAYETSMRFIEYAVSVQNYFDELGYPALSLIFGVATLVICTAFLTVPACFILFRFFNTSNLTSTQIESKLKPIF